MAPAYEKTLALLQLNPQHPSLRLHKLGGRLQGVHSVSINLSYRITLHLLVTEREIVPLDVGDHDAVYRRGQSGSGCHRAFRWRHRS